MASELEKSKIEHINVGKPICGRSSKQKLGNAVEVKVSINNVRLRNYLSVVVGRDGRSLSQVKAHVVRVRVSHRSKIELGH